MKKIIFFILIFFFFPFSEVLAHGGVQNTVNNITVTFFQSPFSAEVNKNTTITLILTDKNTQKRVSDYSAILRINETIYGHEDQDKIVFEKNVKSDINGVIAFDYVFSKTQIYDIELEFPQIKDKENGVGFLVEPRNNNVSYINYFLIAVLSLLAGIFLGYKAHRNNI